MPRTRKKEPLNRDGELFGARLKELRLKRGMTLQALADEAEMSLTYLSDMERGMKIPSLTTMIRLAVALRCKVADLVRTIDAEGPQNLLPPPK